MPLVHQKWHFKISYSITRQLKFHVPKTCIQFFGHFSVCLNLAYYVFVDTILSFVYCQFGISGLIIQKTGDINVPYYVVGAAEAFGGCVYFFIKCLRKKPEYEVCYRKSYTHNPIIYFKITLLAKHSQHHNLIIVVNQCSKKLFFLFSQYQKNDQ